MKLTNEIKIGLTVVLAALIGVIGFRVMRNVPLFEDGQSFYAVFAKVDGLSKGKKILFNGVEIGAISEVKLIENDSVFVILSINTEINFPIDSKAFIRSTDILGSKAIIIEKGKSSQNLTNNSRIKGVYDDGMLGELQEKGLSLGDKVAEIGENLNRVLKNTNETLTDQFKKNLQQSVENLNSMLKESDNLIKTNKSEVNAAIKSLSEAMATLDSISTENRPEIKEVLSQLNLQLKKLDTLSNSLNEASAGLIEILNRINRGEGTLGKLSNDPSLYNQLDSLALNLQRLVGNIDKDPKKYLQHIDITLF